MTSVRFLNFWPDFSQRDNFFIELMESSGLEPTLVSDRSEHADVLFLSVFENSANSKINKLNRFFRGHSHKFQVRQESAAKLKYQKLRKVNKEIIWFTGENIRPPLDENLSMTLSFEQDDFDGLNLYLPLWILDLNWLTCKRFNSRSGIFIEKQNLLSPRRLPSDFFDRKFACVFANKPHPIRDRAIKKLRTIGEIDIYGRISRQKIEFKSSVSHGYQFIICFENDLYPGYVTEKLLEAYSSGCIPLYWGNLGNDDYFNRNAFFNLAEYSSLEDFTSYLKSISREEIYKTFAQPLFRRLPTMSDFDPLLKVLSR